MPHPSRFPLLACLLLAASVAAAEFTVVDGRILDPEGRVFIPAGVNINGANWVWPREMTQDAAAMQDVWNFNLVRVTCFINKPGGGWLDNNDLDRLIAGFTARKIVVMLEPHDRTGDYFTSSTNPTLAQLVSWHTALAQRHKNNPYVWFNVMNEPGANTDVQPQWLTIHQAVIRALRDDVGARNMIVCDGHCWGTEDGSNGAGLVPDRRSAVLTYGPDVITFGGKTYPNIVFNFHVYAGWNIGGVTKFADYLDRVKAKGLCVFVGEWGMKPFDPYDSTPASDFMFQAILPRGVGQVAWHWYGGDHNQLTTNGGGGWMATPTNGARPTNLTWMGEKAWDAAHLVPQVRAPGTPLSKAGWTATAYRSYGSEVAACLVDGDYATRWLNGEPKRNDGSQWFTIDMGAPRAFTSVWVEGRSSNGLCAGAIFQVSDNNATWTTVQTIGPGHGTTRIWLPTARTARYLRFINTGVNGWLGVGEVDVYHNPGNQAPYVGLHQPIDGTRIAAGASLSPRAAAHDLDGSVARVEFWSGTTRIGESTTAPYVCPAWTPASGTHVITARAFDNAGAMVASNAATLIVGAGSANRTPVITAPAVASAPTLVLP